MAGERWVGLDLRPQAPDVDVDEAAIAEVAVAPDPLEQLLAAHDLVRRGRKLAEQSELRSCAVHLGAVSAAEHALVREEHEIADRGRGLR